MPERFRNAIMGYSTCERIVVYIYSPEPSFL
jgi:hypothetical protein